MKNIYTILFLAIFMAVSLKETRAQCTANFSYTTSGDTATFTDHSTAGFGTVITWLWNFGDGGFSGSQNPTHTFAACGIYTVSLTIGTTAFCINTYTTTVTVNGGIPASFTYNIDSTNGNVNFLAAPLALNLNYVWNYGDGTYDSAAFASHTFPAGTYNVCLTVADNNNVCNATACDTIVVLPPDCSTSFTWNNNGNGIVNFQVTPFHFGMTYTWDFGDSTAGNGPFIIHNFPVSGNYFVCLTAVDSATMCSSHFCDTVSLSQDTSNCNVSFTYGNNNGQVGFIANSLSLNNSYAWDFGDGNVDSSFAVSNTYMASGTYYACLTTTNSFDLCTATFCDSVEVVIAGIEEWEPGSFGLKIYPNPARDVADILYRLGANANVELLISDMPGKTIAVIESGQQGSGAHSLSWNVENIESGVYFLQIKINGRTRAVQKIVVAK